MAEKPVTPRRRPSLRDVARVALGIGLLAFLLPFTSVSCGSVEVIHATGLNAAAGGQYTLGGQQQIHFYPGDEYFLLAIMAAVIALTSQLLRRYARVRAIVSAVTGIASVVMLLIGQAHVNSQILDLHTNGVVTVRWGVGYWVAMTAISVGTVVALAESYGVVMRPKSGGAVAPPSASTSSPPPPLGSVPGSWVTPAGGVIAIIAALMIISACALPYMRFAGSSVSLEQDSPSLFVPGFGPSIWFAAEPVAVAILAFGSGVVLIEWRSRIAQAIAVGVLLAFGIQTTLLFFGYVALAVGSESAKLGPGGVVGMISGVVLLAGGLVPLFKVFARGTAPIAGGPPIEATAAH